MGSYNPECSTNYAYTPLYEHQVARSMFQACQYLELDWQLFYIPSERLASHESFQEVTIFTGINYTFEV